MDDLKRQMMAEDDVYSYSDDEQLAGMGCGRIFKINAARIGRSNFSLCWHTAGSVTPESGAASGSEKSIVRKLWVY